MLTSYPGLLVSVRSVAEAAIALAAGADLIDVKEPAQGSLGKAGDAVIRAVVQAVDGARPISAAMGEWREGNLACPDPGLSFLKWGLAGAGKCGGWRTFLDGLLETQPHPQPVIVAYADWQCAQAPDADEVVNYACRRPGNVLLVDTHCKDAATLGRQRPPTLLDWLPLAWIAETCTHCREAGVRIALAGSLGYEEMEQLLPVQPDWFAVRGLVCSSADRQATLDPDNVHRLAEWLQRPATFSSHASHTGTI